MTTITEVSRTLNVSTRMLRYYEQQGLIASCRRPDYAYRLYDAENVSRLRIILVLRKLRVPLKAIAEILTDCDASAAVAVLQERVREVEGEIRSMAAIRDMLTLFIQRISGAQDLSQRVALMGDDGMLRAVQALGLSNPTLKEKVIMSEMNQAEMEQWKRLNVRFIMLPPMTVAAFHYIGPDPEEHVGEMASRFVQESHLYEVKPDSRMFGFNHPNPSPDRPHYGYENWLSIPEDMEVPAPGVKKRFPGGLYAAHAIDFGNFHEWQWLYEWVENNPDWMGVNVPEGPEIMFGGLEEHLNWVYAAHQGWPEDGVPGKIDLLLPVERRRSAQAKLSGAADGGKTE
ncbi:MAG: MerR family transcriptional regulator [Clostridiales bacterium]|nr:MerR family transcriptional regulator [Clostridiales bacterium]